MAKNKTMKFDIDFTGRFAAGLCIRIHPGDPILKGQESYIVSVIKKLTLFDQIADFFQTEDLGLEFDRNADSIRLLCSFPLEERTSFAENSILPQIRNLEQELSCSLICGVGQVSVNRLHLEESLQTAVEACDLFFFEKETFFEYEKRFRPLSVSFDDYENYSEIAFRSILTKSADALNKIEDCLELIRKIHYGNKQAVIMRTMNYSGELTYRLHRYNLLTADFYGMLDQLQGKVLAAITFEEMKRAMLEHYRLLLEMINRESRTGRKTMIEQVKTYIRENYMEDLSVKDLAAIACVSPGYFSHMFKDVTGTAYKTYLTDVRMEAASELLFSSDLRLYEISERVGYNNVRNFTEAFHKKYGMSPSEYRKELLS